MELLRRQLPRGFPRLVDDTFREKRPIWLAFHRCEILRREVNQADVLLGEAFAEAAISFQRLGDALRASNVRWID